MSPDRLAQQFALIAEMDKLKKITRQTLLLDRSRSENDAEHSWHLAVMALLLAEHAAEKTLDLFRVVRMVLIHDLVEIDAGDVCVYKITSEVAKEKLQSETKAADRIFNLLPPDQAREIRALWDEFEARKTPEAKFAAALDRVQPLMHNLLTEGHVWKKHGVRYSEVIARNQHIAEGSPVLWEYIKKRIDQAVEAGWLGQG